MRMPRVSMRMAAWPTKVICINDGYRDASQVAPRAANRVGAPSPSRDR
jgi:hypothetical protein